MSQEGFKRKLTSIFSADAVGYSRLMGEDEAATVRTITSYRNAISTLIEQHNGTVIDSAGDNLLAEFVSVVDAVQCAVAVQKTLKARNGDLPENRRMQFRIGINLGDVIQEEDRIYGDGVNIAARLEALAEPGGICISGLVHDQVEKVITCCQKVLRENPDDIQASLTLTRAYGGAGLEEKARLAAQNVLRIDPGYSLKNYSNTSFLKNKSKLQRSIEVLRQAGLPD